MLGGLKQEMPTVLHLLPSPQPVFSSPSPHILFKALFLCPVGVFLNACSLSQQNSPGHGSGGGKPGFAGQTYPALPCFDPQRSAQCLAQIRHVGSVCTGEVERARALLHRWGGPRATSVLLLRPRGGKAPGFIRQNHPCGNSTWLCFFQVAEIPRCNTCQKISKPSLLPHKMHPSAEKDSRARIWGRWREKSEWVLFESQ